MILYKLDSKGNTRYLRIYNEGTEVIQESGLLDTESPVVHRKTCKPKNVGKKNETSATRQAELEAKSIVLDKLTKGYFESIKEMEEGKVILPMLAKDYNKESKKIDWEGKVYVQPKLDGMRCLITIGPGKITFMSRDGKQITTMAHIEEDLSYIWGSTKRTVTYDGELYCHGLSFQENMKLIKKIGPETKNVKFCCYDMVDEDSSYSGREAMRDDLCDAKYVEFVETTPIKSHEEMLVQHAKNCENGYEGSIIRHGPEGYKKNARSSSLLKFKDFMDIAVKIIDVIPADKRPEWGVPVLEYGDVTFEAGARLSHLERVDLLKNKKKYIGKIAEIRFFEWTDGGKPRHPVMVGMRLDKSKPDDKE